MTRLLPYPLMAAALLLLWLLLQGSASPGAIAFGAVLGLAGSALLAVLRVPRARLRRLRPLPRLLRDVAAEVVRSNIAVARIILRPSERRSGFVRVTLDMRSPRGLAALACILTATPGTVWVDYDARSGAMLLHVLDLVDEQSWVGLIKERWERPLMEIFE